MAEPQASAFRAQVGGSALAVLKWGFPGEKQQTIAFAREFTNRPPHPVAEKQAVQPLDQVRPIEVVTAYAQGHGELDIVLYQLYNFEVWQRLKGIANSQDFVDIARSVVSQNAGISVIRYVTPPVPNHAPYQEQYFNCVVADYSDDQPINIATMLIERTLTLAYTHAKKDYINNNSFLIPTNGVSSEG